MKPHSSLRTILPIVILVIGVLPSTLSSQQWRHLPVADPVLLDVIKVDDSEAVPPEGGLLPAPAGTISLSYFNPSYPLQKWLFPATYGGSLTIAALCERMTLPGDAGRVSSVSLRIDSVSSSGSIGVLLFPDTLFPITGRGAFHLPNIFSASADAYISKAISVMDVRPGEFITIPMDNALVPKEFFVVVNSQIQGTLMKLVGDSGPTVPRTTESSRSVMIAINQLNQVLAALLDSSITFDGQTVVYSNLYITSHVDTSGVTSVDVVRPSVSILQVYPNPVTTTAVLQVKETVRGSTLTLHDAMGREVRDFTSGLRQDGESNIAFSVRDLPAGLYVLRYVTPYGTALQRMTVLR